MNILDYYGGDQRPVSHVKPEVVIPPPAVIVPGQALTRFLADPAGLKNDALNLLSITVRPVETLEAASGLSDKVAQAETLIKNIKARRLQHVEPLKKEALAIEAEAHRWADPIEAFVKRAKDVLLAFRRFDEDKKRREAEERDKAIREAAERQQAAEANGDTAQAEAASLDIMKAEAVTATAPLRGFKTDSGSTSIRRRWTVDVVDSSLVPDVYWAVDLKKLQAAVDAGARAIDGCNIWEQESLTVRTRG